MRLQGMAEALAEGTGLLHVYHPLGYPSGQLDQAYLNAAVQGGAQVLELGIPFSDPVADGPALQAASTRALHRGATPQSALATIATMRHQHPRVGLVVMAYANTLHAMGWKESAQALATAGADGLIVPDMPFAEARRIAPLLARHGVAWIPLLSTTVPPETVRAIAALQPPFAYLASLGVTGRAGAGPGAEVAATLRNIRQEAPGMPMAVGFGIRNASDVRTVRKAGAQGVVVGTALVQRIEGGAGPDAYQAEIARLYEACR